MLISQRRTPNDHMSDLNEDSCGHDMKVSQAVHLMGNLKFASALMSLSTVILASSNPAILQTKFSPIRMLLVERFLWIHFCLCR